MARIEINLNEYNGLKQRIKTLENSLTDLTKELDSLNQKMNEMDDLMEDLENETLTNRLFHWKKILKPIKEILKR